MAVSLAPFHSHFPPFFSATPPSAFPRFPPFPSNLARHIALAWNLLTRDALDGKGPQRRPQQRLGRRVEEVAKAVGGGYCRLQMPLSPALGVRGTVAGNRSGALEKGRGGYLPPVQCLLLLTPATAL